MNPGFEYRRLDKGNAVVLLVDSRMREDEAGPEAGTKWRAPETTAPTVRQENQ